MTLKLTKTQERAIKNEVGMVKIELDTVPEPVLNKIKEEVQERMYRVCEVRSGNDPLQSSFLPHKSDVEKETVMHYENDLINESEIGKIVTKHGGTIDGGCQMKTNKDGSRSKNTGNVTALFKTGSDVGGEGIVDIDFRSKKKNPSIMISWKNKNSSYNKDVPRSVFHDALAEFGIHAPSGNQQCILTEREPSNDFDYQSYNAKCFGYGKSF